MKWEMETGGFLFFFWKKDRVGNGELVEEGPGLRVRG